MLAIVKRLAHRRIMIFGEGICIGIVVFGSRLESAGDGLQISNRGQVNLTSVAACGRWTYPHPEV